MSFADSPPAPTPPSTPPSTLPLWRVTLLGDPCLVRPGGGGAPQRIAAGQKTTALLAFLCLNDRAHARDELADRFWPESDGDAARASLRVALSHLRRLLEPPGPSALSGSVLLADRRTVRLCPGSVASDLGDFRAALKAAKRAGTTGDTAAARRRHLQAAVRMGENGPLLPGVWDDWVIEERDRVAREFADAQAELAALPP